jgi:hypothetical protein
MYILNITGNYTKYQKLRYTEVSSVISFNHSQYVLEVQLYNKRQELKFLSY